MGNFTGNLRALECVIVPFPGILKNLTRANKMVEWMNGEKEEEKITSLALFVGVSYNVLSSIHERYRPVD